MHRAGLGIANLRPASLVRSVANARSRELAATPPAIKRCSIPSRLAARTALLKSTSTTASWNEAAISARALCDKGPEFFTANSMCRATALFNPEKEKLNSFVDRSVSSVNKVIALGKLIAVAFPVVAKRSNSGPPGNGKPNNLAILSKASPAASSMVAPMTLISFVTSSTFKIDVCPPLTSNAIVAGITCSVSKYSTATCAAK